MEPSTLEYIHSKDNKRIKRALLLKQRKYRQTYNEYLLEGVRLIRDILDRDALKVVLVKESKASLKEIETLISQIQAIGTIKIFIVQDPIFAKLEDTVHTQGVIGIAKKTTHLLDEATFDDGLYIAIDGVQDPGNLGTIIRTAVAAGAKGVFLLKGTVDVYNDKVVRSTMSALHHIPIYEDITISTFNDILKDHSMTAYVTTLEAAQSYDSIAYAPKSIIVVGNEGNGVSKEILSLCQVGITIPMYGPMESLNVAVAAALCMYKVREQM
ncbi:TrmH family RNA methyltransferase [Veillonella agrestimuris]|uniref:TrmH family RNA methyltransferase n=1 Tax=Veillonella agrestimuris TaxID=2941340 RepID=UPI00203EF08C|nr:RNA methyltransferase [Veillonella agrestimuris]